MPSARMIRSSAFAVALSVALAGCASVAPVSSIPEATRDTPGSRAAAEIGLTVAERPQEMSARAWWTAFDDRTLDALIERATSKNHDVRIAVASLRQARAVLGERRLDRLPSGGVDADYTRRRLAAPDIDPSGTTDAVGPVQRIAGIAAFASWEIDLFGRIGTSRAIAERQVDVALADRQAAIASLQADVVRNYLSLRAAQIALVALADEEASAELAHLLVRQRVDAGVDDPREAARSEARLAETRAEAARRKAEAEAHLTALSVLIGDSPLQPDAVLTHGGPMPEAPALQAIPAPAEALSRRPDVRRADAVLRATQGQKVLAERAFLPSLTIDLSGGLKQAPGLLSSDGAEAFTIAGLLRWNPLEFGRLRARARAADAADEGAVVSFEQTLLRALQDIEDSLQRWHAAARASRQADRASAAAQAAAEVTRARVAAGIENRIQGELAMLDASRAEREAIAAKAELGQAYAYLQLALAAWQPAHADTADVATAWPESSR